MGALAASPGVAVMPAPEKVALQSNYITNFDFLNQYLPDTYSEEFERYGNRSVASFLRMVGAETPFSSDLLKWTEQGRLHAKYVNCASSAAATTDLATITVNDTLDPGTVASLFVQDKLFIFTIQLQLETLELIRLS
jgi:hypothetical protein